MKIAILGTRGIPNNYGGFEQCAEYLSKGLVKQGYDVAVYNSHNHPYQQSEWNGVKILHQYDPEKKLGTLGQFIYDFNCILDSRKHNFDIILQLGYTSSSIWGGLLPKEAIITTNMDGLEWKRTKYSKKVKKFLKYAESLGVSSSDYLISDSLGIKEYLTKKYNKVSTYIPYGANLFQENDLNSLSKFDLTQYGYDLLIARLEPENSIEIILDGVTEANMSREFLVVGNHQTPFGEYLKKKFMNFPKIRFLGGIYDIGLLNNLRYYSNIYFHGHTVGGTNPSLIEAMASNSLICANNNLFNRSILEQNAFYFRTKQDVSKNLISIDRAKQDYQKMVQNNRQKVIDVYSWDNIVDQYAEHFNIIYNSREFSLQPSIFKNKPFLRGSLFNIFIR